jgi:Asp-tRNA(Asn)/Glu-tRNA(Gln) amidotransferase A subunit family amidase
MKDLWSAWKLDIAAVGSQISDKSVSPVALTEMMLDRIARIDPLVLSYVRVLTDDASRSAEVAERSWPGHTGLKSDGSSIPMNDASAIL